MKAITSFNLKNVVAGMQPSARDINALIEAVASPGLASAGEFTTSGRVRSESANRPLKSDQRQFFKAVPDDDFDEFSILGISGGTNPDNRPKVDVHAAEDGDLLVTNHNVAMTDGDECMVTLLGHAIPTIVRLSDSVSEAGDEVGPIGDGSVSEEGTGLILLTDKNADNDRAFAVLKPSPVVRIVEITSSGSAAGPGKIINAKVKKITNDPTDAAGTTVTLDDTDPVQNIKVINFRPNWVAEGMCFLARKIGKFWVLENDAAFQDFMVP